MFESCGLKSFGIVIILPSGIVIIFGVFSCTFSELNRLSAGRASGILAFLSEGSLLCLKSPGKAPVVSPAPTGVGGSVKFPGVTGPGPSGERLVVFCCKNFVIRLVPGSKPAGEKGVFLLARSPVGKLPVSRLCVRAIILIL